MSKKSKTLTNETWSLTVGNGGENHTGMEFLGKLRKRGEGWDLSRLQCAKQVLEDIFGKKVEIYDLNTQCLNDVDVKEELKPQNAYLMICRGFLNEETHKRYIKELKSYKWDNKYYDTRRKKVLNKHARENVCYGSVNREPDYENKKGTIIGYDKSPMVYRLKQVIEMLMREKDLIVEGNYYRDAGKNGIGAHGDTERVIVACLRVGADMPIKYGCFNKSKLQGKTFQTVIKGGDLYFMSEDAVGAQWKYRSKWVYRHAAGAPKYLKMN